MFRKRSDLDLERLNSGTSEKPSKSKSQISKESTSVLNAALTDLTIL